MKSSELFSHFSCVEFSPLNERKVPLLPGCYVCTDDDDTVLYIGMSKTGIRDRYDEHLLSKEEGADMLLVTRFCWVQLELDTVEHWERDLLDTYEKQEGRLPKYNDRRP